jgi:TusA-related sulfurtransferase
MERKEIFLDVSDLEAPQPLIQAVVAMDKLKKNEVLVFQHRMNPRHLFNEITARYMAYEVVQDKPNQFIMKIWRE